LRIASTCYQHPFLRANIVYKSRKRIYGFDIDFPVEQLCVNDSFQDSNGCLLSNQNIDLTFSFREAPSHVHVLSHFSGRELVFEKLEDPLLINRPSWLRFPRHRPATRRNGGFSTIVNRRLHSQPLTQ